MGRVCRECLGALSHKGHTAQQKALAFSPELAGFRDRTWKALDCSRLSSAALELERRLFGDRVLKNYLGLFFVVSANRMLSFFSPRHWAFWNQKSGGDDVWNHNVIFFFPKKYVLRLFREPISSVPGLVRHNRVCTMKQIYGYSAIYETVNVLLFGFGYCKIWPVSCIADIWQDYQPHLCT